MTGEWKNYIQVNIYGRTLSELNSEGITLKSVLENIGCDKIWIMEGSVHTGEQEEPEPTKPVLSTTIVTSKVPRFSTPMHSLNQFPFADFSLDETSEDDEEEDVAEVVGEVVEKDVEECFEEDAHEDVEEEADVVVLEKPGGVLSVTQPISVPSDRKNTCARRKSAPETRKNAVVSKSIRQPLLRTTSETKPISNAAVLLKTNTAPQVPGPVILKEEEFQSVTVDQGEAYFTMDDPNSTNETLQMEVENFEDTIEMHTPSSPSRKPSRSILKRNSRSCQRMSSKAVSFKSPRRINSRRNKLHVIKCCFKDCSRTLNWRMKYGKLNLIDHALSHSSQKHLECRFCDFSCVTVRQMRYHYKTGHNEEKMEGYGMLNVFSIPLEKMDVRKTWTACYHRQMHIVGHISTRTVRRKKPEVDEQVDVVADE